MLARRQGFNADTWGYVPILLLIGAIIAWLLPAICEESPDGTPLGLPIRGYGMMMLLAVVSGTLLAAWRAKRVGLDPDLIFTLIFWMLIPGIIGARGFHVIEYWRARLLARRMPAKAAASRSLVGEIVNVTHGGLVVYGSFFGGVLGMLLFVRKYRAAAAGPGRSDRPRDAAWAWPSGAIGCLLNGCCFGGVCDHPGRSSFPPIRRPTIAQAAARPDVRLRSRRQSRRQAVRGAESRSQFARRLAPG